jgi:hypothetical protein
MTPDEMPISVKFSISFLDTSSCLLSLRSPLSSRKEEDYSWAPPYVDEHTDNQCKLLRLTQEVIKR